MLKQFNSLKLTRGSLKHIWLLKKTTYFKIYFKGFSSKKNYILEKNIESQINVQKKKACNNLSLIEVRQI